MSKTIDEKVVSMQFDNRQFEANVRTSMGTIDKLKQSLNFKSASKGLENVNAAAKNVNMSGLAGGIETVKAKFSALEVIGVTALANITNSAVNAGKRIISSLTLDPVRDGFAEYETQMNAVQTILANTQKEGTNVAIVNKYLDELNTYADKTIYNFTEMTRNIGTFTAAGVKLETSVSAIKGIANLAAVSGSTSQQASTAMYQLSQAIASGTVKLMDWNSVVNAGMGGQVFQDALVRTSEHLKTGAKAAISAEGSFRESLTTGWLTTEVLTQTLDQFATAADTQEEYEAAVKKFVEQGYTQEEAKQMADMAKTAGEAATKVKTFTQLIDTLKEALGSGWTKTWQLIIGDFEEARELWTSVSDVVSGFINKISDTRNKLLESALGKSFTGLSEKIKGILEPAKSVADTVKNVTGTIGDLGKIVDDVINGKFGNGKDRFNALTEAGQNYYKIQNKVNEALGNSFRYTDEQISAQDKLLGSQEKTADAINETSKATEELTEADKEQLVALCNLSDEQLRSKGYTEEQIKAFDELRKTADKLGIPLGEFIENLDKINGRWLLINSFKNIGRGLIKIFKSIGEAWRDIFPAIQAEQLFNIIAGFHKFTTYLVMNNEQADKLKRTFKGLFAILDIVRTVVGGAFSIAFKVAKKVLSMFNLDILDVTASIGDAIVKFHDWVFENGIFAKALEKTVNIITRAIKKIKEWFTAFKNLPKVQNALTKFRSVCSNTVSDLGDYFKGGIDRINAFIDRIKAMDSITLDDLDDIFRDFKDNVIDYFLDIDGRFEDIKESFRSFKESAKQHLTEAGNKFDWLKDKILGFAGAIKDKISGNIGMGEILTVGIGAGLIFFVKKIGDALETIAGPIGEIAAVFTNFNGVLKGVQKVLNAFAMKTKAEALLKIALAIAVLAGSIALLTLLDPGKMWSAIGAIGALAAILLALATAMNFLNKNSMSISKEGIKKTSSSLLGIAAALGILVLALKVMDGLDAGKMWSNLGILGVMAAGLVGIAVILNKAAPDLTKGSFTFIAIALALKIMVSALTDLEKIKMENITRTIELFSYLVIGLAVLALAAKGLGVGSGIAVLAIVIALKLLVSAFNDIAELDTDKIKSNINAFIAIFGTLAALMIASSFAGKNAAKAGLGILAMSAALILIIAAIKMLAKMSPSDLKKGLKAVSQLLLIFGVVVALSKFAGQNAAKAGVMLLAMAGAMLILTAVIVVLSHVDPSGLKRALGAITTLELVFGALIAITRFAGEADKVRGTLVILAVTIGIMAIALGALSMINPENLYAATASLSIVIGMFSLLVASTHFVQKAAGTLAVLAATVLVLGGVLYLLAGLPVESTLGTAAALSVLLLSLSAAMVITSKIKAVSPDAYVALGVMTLVVAALATIIGVLAYLNVGPVLEIAASLSILLLSLSAACAILSKNKVSVKRAVDGALALSAFVGILTGLLIVLGGLAQIPGLEWLISEGGDFLQEIGTALGQFVGGIVGGFGVGMSAGLPEIATNLSDFMTNLQPFIDGAKGFDESTMNGVKSLAETILILCGANLLDTITSWITGGSSLADFAAQLVPFGEAMADFSAKVAGNIDEGAVTAAANAGKIIADMASTLPNSGGVVGFFMGENDMADFAAQLVPFGEAMADFSAKVAGNIDEEAVTAAANAGKIMADMASTLPNSGGVLGFFAGENDMDDFAAQLVPFGEAMVSFSSKVAGNIDTEAVTSAANAGKIMAEMAATLPNSGGVAGFFAGENDVDDFGTKLVSFGESIVSFSSKVSGNIDAEAVTAAANAGKIMSEFAQTLPEDTSIWERITGGGKQSLGDFAKQLPPFGEGIQEFSNALGDNINVSAVRAAATAGKTMAEMASELDGTEDVSILSELSSELPTFGQAMVDFSSKVNDLSTSSLSSNVNKFKDVIRTLTDISKSGLDEFVKNFSSGESKAISSINKMLIGVIKTIKAKGTVFASLGKGLMVNFVRGINSNKTPLSSAFSKSLESAITSIKNYYNKFYAAGAYVVMGFVNGIDANTYKAEGKAAAMALKAEAAAKAALNAHSPSKVFYEIGTFAGQGFVNAFGDYESKSYAAGFDMAENAKNGLSKAISTVRDLIDNGMDDQLTIRPVLDLSDITSGANRLNGLFNTNPSVGLLSNVRSVSSMMNRNQNGANYDVVSAINNLRKDMSDMPRNSYVIDGITYDDGSNISEAVKTLVRAARIERRT